jgi:hypothetical protein
MTMNSILSAFMSASLRLRPLRALTLSLVLALAPAACDDADSPTVGTLPDGGVPGRSVSDTNLRDPVMDGATDMAPDDDAGMDAMPDVNSEAGPALRIDVNIVSPLEGGVVPALLKFTPEVDVFIDSPQGNASDALKDLNAEIIERTSKKVVASGKLNQVGFHMVPESTRLVYEFADSPIDIAAVLSGNYDLVVTAITNGGVEVKATRAFQIDAGPAINIASPGKDKAYKGSAPIDVTIVEDYFGPVSDVQMKVGQSEVVFAGPGGAGGNQYTATLDFASYIPALEGEQILTVRAKNKNGTESVVVRKFISDSKGPQFASATPKDGDLVGNVISISVEVTDPAGVLSSSVVAVFANGPGTEYTIPLRAPAAGDPRPLYSAVFDTRLLPFGENALFPTLSFRASDSLGNEALLTNVVWLDNRPPLAELDPPDMRLWAKTDSGRYGCSWKFDPVGADAADDGDIVPQIVDIRARIEDQGNDPLSGMPNYIPIAAVDTAQLLILDDISKPLVVNTNPVAMGNRKADDLCDAINPLLIPTTRPMTASDALLVTLTPMAATGLSDLSNGIHTPAVGEDGSCLMGDNAGSPEAVCEVSRTAIKARWGYNPLKRVWQAHSDVLTLVLGYGGGGSTTKLSSIWTIPKQESGAANPLCGGTQLDTLANFVNDGWACLALFTSDKLGNKQVSRPFRLCIDKDANGAECPHKQIAQVASGTPIIVQTVADHGFVTGDEVRVSGIAMMAMVNGPWKVTVLDARTFSLDGSLLEAGVPTTTWVRPSADPDNPFVPGFVVKTSELPNCTGTVTTTTPSVVVDGAKTCQPWRLYRQNEIRTY